MSGRLPSLTVILATVGRPTLAATLRSIAAQELLPGDEVLLAVDGPSADAARRSASR